MAPALRLARPTDLDALVTLAGELRDFLQDPGPSDAVFRQGFARLLVDPTAAYLVAEDGAGAVIGYVALRLRDSAWHAGTEAELEDVVVAARARGQGLGRRLGEAAIAHARGLGCQAVGLTTNERNGPALALYEALGLRADRARWDGGRQLWLQRKL